MLMWRLSYTYPCSFVTLYHLWDGNRTIMRRGQFLRPAAGEYGEIQTVRRGTGRTTGRIAKQLCPKAHIDIKGYDQTNFEKNSFDIALGSVPNGWAQSDSRKMPLSNAVTEVLTDILFPQKREQPIMEQPDWVHTDNKKDRFAINRYFIQHPEMEVKSVGNTRTLAFQAPESLFQRVKQYLARNQMTQRPFGIGLIEDELERDKALLRKQQEETPADEHGIQNNSAAPEGGAA